MVRGSRTPFRDVASGVAVAAPEVARAKAAAPPTNGTRAEVRVRSSVSFGLSAGGSMRPWSVPATISARRWPFGTTWSVAARSRVIVYRLPGVSGEPLWSEAWLPRSAQPRLTTV